MNNNQVGELRSDLGGRRAEHKTKQLAHVVVVVVVAVVVLAKRQIAREIDLFGIHRSWALVGLRLAGGHHEPLDDNLVKSLPTPSDTLQSHL